MELNLLSQGLGGQISPSLGKLVFLNTLDLSGNNFIGILPPLNNLQQLQILNLNNNYLTGVIPDSLTNCSSLIQLDLSSNLLVGEIPPNIGSLSNLEYISLKSNQLEGRIPDEIGKLPRVTDLHLGQNKLSGGIPQALLNLSSLITLGLEVNLLGNELSPNIGDLLPNLTELTLGDNMFEGRIPASIGNASGLSRIDLSKNKFNGQVPNSFGKLSNLSYLSLYTNNLQSTGRQTSELFNALINCTSLQFLSLADNQLLGTIPYSIGNLSSGLQGLLLGQNQLSGIVPPSIGQLHNLISLGLGHNSFSGTIGEWVGRMTNLQILLVQENNFTGPIPSSVSNLTQLTGITLKQNGFSGPIPAWFANLTRLLRINLGYNDLEGNIPQELDKLPLIELTLSSNKLSGEIPGSLGRCQNLQSLQLDQNFLTGNIPASFGNLTNLNYLNLSHNKLFGPIPTSLNDVPLSTLDLSYNNLQGDIPKDGVFKNPTTVSLSGNPELCGGIVELHMPSCPKVSHKAASYYLIRLLIPIFGFMSLALLAYFIILEKKMRRRKNISMDSFGEHFPKVSYKDLAQATNNFSENNLIGKGSHGSVYRGKLKDPEMEMAVKVFDTEMQGAERSFLSECEALRCIQHRNLLPIITVCSTVDNGGNAFKALVYEFMPNGNLDTWLHHKEDTKDSKHLGLGSIISIGVNIADVLDYLHHDCGRTTVHCDLKPSNILLDDNMNAILGDFGIARFCLDSRSIPTGSASIGLKGTIGYIPPEYAGIGHVSTAGDVYSFGVVLLEMITGKRPTDPMFTDGLDIINFVESNFPDKILHIIGNHLIEECKNFTEVTTASENTPHRCLLSLLEVALSCSRPLPSERMNMKQVANKMHSIMESYIACKIKKHASLELE
ncbi:hypothetical protein DAI22_01g207764 [Oryza sativa Japonica Group]|nr:hypothetical protein DAI22_01g207764 [Oryza sativa Japonica Group]